jgi:hypothetical protein
VAVSSLSPKKRIARLELAIMIIEKCVDDDL